MPAVFANPYASRSQHISSQKIAQLRLKIYALSGWVYNFDMNELEDAGFDGIYEKSNIKSNLAEILTDDI